MLLLLFSNNIYLYSKKARIAVSTAYSFRNEITSSRIGIGSGIYLAYPVSDKSRLFNTEISVLTYFKAFPKRLDYMNLLKFGFGIRIFFNKFKIIRPYFTHDITSQITWLKKEKGKAPTYSILLGLGIDIPFGREKDKECNSIFFDVSYNFFRHFYFGTGNNKVNYLSITIGYSQLIKKN